MNKRRLLSVFGLPMVVLAFIGINLLAHSLLPNQQLDLSQHRIYSLSQPSLQLLQQLEQPLQLSLYFSAKSARQLPQFQRHAEQAREILQQYVRHSNGQLSLQLLQPEPFSALEDLALASGLQPVRLASGEQLFLGLVATDPQGRSHSIALLDPQQEQLLEYHISRLLQRSQQRQLSIGLMSSLDLYGSFDLISGTTQAPWQIVREVEQQYQLRQLDSHGDQIPADIDLLWLVQPQNLPVQSLFAIDQFVLRGGKLLLFLDPYSEQLPARSMAGHELEARSAELPQLLAAWGVQLQPRSLIADLRYAMPVSVPMQSSPVPHPTWLHLDRNALNQQQSVTAALHSLSLASAGMLQPLPQASTSFTPLIHSSTQAAPLSSELLLGLSNPAELLPHIQPSGHSYTIAARISGAAQSIFPQGIEGQPEPITAADNIDLIVVADSDLLHDSMWLLPDGSGQLQAWNDNASLVLNAIDSLGGSQQLANIRSQVQYSRPFTKVEQMRRTARQQLAHSQQLLEQRLQHVEQQLTSLRNQPDSGASQQQLLDDFLQQRLHLRQQLRQLQHDLNADIERLGLWIKLINGLLMPFALGFVILLLAIYRRYQQGKPDAA